MNPKVEELFELLMLEFDDDAEAALLFVIKNEITDLDMWIEETQKALE